MTAQYYKKLLNITEEVKVTHTCMAFKQAVKYAKGMGRKLVCIMWNGAVFEDLIIIREYED